MAYQFYNPAPVFFDLLGLEPCAGGTLTFNGKGTNDPKDTYSDEEGTIPNANPVTLDSAGRSNTHIWLDGDYTVVLKDADGVTVFTRDVTSGQGAGATIPEMEDGEFLTNNGTDLLWAAVRQVPDPTGSANRVLGTDGANLLWVAQTAIPDPPEPDIVVGASSFQAGTSDDATKHFEQWGTGSAPASGTRSTSAAINFPTAFGTLGHVSVSITSTSVTAAGGLPSVATTGGNGSGFTATFYSGDEDNGDNADITSAVNFTWYAVGTREVA